MKRMLKTMVMAIFLSFRIFYLDKWVNYVLCI